MAKVKVQTEQTATEQTTAVATVITKHQFAEIAANTSDDDLDGRAAMFAAAKQVNTKELKKVAGDDYLELEEGETYVFICRGILVDALPSKRETGKLVNAVSLENEEGTMLINADTVLVSTVSRMKLEEFPCMLQIHVKGMKKSGLGSYKDLDIYKY